MENGYTELECRVVYDKATGRIVHTHHTLVVPGAAVPSDEDIDAAAINHASRVIKGDPSGLATLRVPPAELSDVRHQHYTVDTGTGQLRVTSSGPELAHLVRNVRRVTRLWAHEGGSQAGAARFPVCCCCGGRCGPAVTGAVQPMLPAAGRPIRRRPGRTRRPSAACAAARPGPPRGQ